MQAWIPSSNADYEGMACAGLAMMSSPDFGDFIDEQQSWSVSSSTATDMRKQYRE